MGEYTKSDIARPDPEDDPEDVKSIASAYFDAGSDMVLTNTFGGSSFKLANFGFEKRDKEVNKSTAELTKSAARSEKFVTGSVGPSGKCMSSEHFGQFRLKVKRYF